MLILDNSIIGIPITHSLNRIKSLLLPFFFAYLLESSFRLNSQFSGHLGSYLSFTLVNVSNKILQEEDEKGRLLNLITSTFMGHINYVVSLFIIMNSHQ